MAPADPTLDINMQLWVSVTMPLNFWHCNDKKVSTLYLLHALYLHDTSSNYYFLFLRLVFICFPWGTIAWRFLHINFLNFAVGGRTKLGHGLLSGKYSIPVAEVWLFQEKKYWMHIRYMIYLYIIQSSKPPLFASTLIFPFLWLQKDVATGDVVRFLFDMFLISSPYWHLNKHTYAEDGTHCFALSWFFTCLFVFNRWQRQEGIPPRMFKSVVAAGHAEFSSMRQQVKTMSFEMLSVFLDYSEWRSF